MLLGRPNVGKSTLLNCLLGRTISITSWREQTTRCNIVGVRTVDTVQTIYLDTPGLGGRPPRGAPRKEHHAGFEAVDADLAVMLIAAPRWVAGDEWVLKRLREHLQIPLLLAINKEDRLDHHEQMLPLLAESMERAPFAELVPISAIDGGNVDRLRHCIEKRLPEAPHRFPADCFSDRDPGFFVAEFVREKMLRLLGQELPHTTRVEVQSISENGERLEIEVLLCPARDRHKQIVIGRGGSMLKRIGTEARHTLQEFFDRPVNLQLWVRSAQKR